MATCRKDLEVKAIDRNDFKNGKFLSEEWSGIETTSNDHSVNARRQTPPQRSNVVDVHIVHGYACAITSLFIDLGQQSITNQQLPFAFKRW